MQLPSLSTLALLVLPLAAAVDVYVYNSAECDRPSYSAGCADLQPGVCCAALNATWHSARFIGRTGHVIKHHLNHRRMGRAHIASSGRGACGPVCGYGHKCVTCNDRINGVSWIPSTHRQHYRPMPQMTEDEVLADDWMGPYKRDIEAPCKKTVLADFVVVDNHYFSINSSVPQNISNHLKAAVLEERPWNELHLSVWDHVHYLDGGSISPPVPQHIDSVA